ncbi:thioredoxin family protein [Candidatus Micrarchaeota archaeon]|nr:thioredoxin family protein [Candidatus Micrarchaeota archaeon]
MTQMKMTLFTKADCPRCPAVKRIINEMKLEKQFTLTELDAASDEGYFEAVKRNIMSTPALILETESGEQKLTGDITADAITAKIKQLGG